MRILIFYKPNELGMSDFSSTDYTTLAKRTKEERDGNFPNFGNKVWLQAIISAISVPGNIWDFGWENISVDFINENFDCVLFPLANIFYNKWTYYLEKRAEIIKKLKIPVYVIACGVQTDSYDELDELVTTIREPATRFIASVYNTGGEFALRGYFTQEFFHRLGFKNAVVTGCPSLFQMGRDLKIPNDKVARSDFIATLNGTFKLPITRENIRKSDFICQDKSGKFLYDPEYIKNNPFTLRRILKYVKRGDYEFVQALADNRIKLFADTQQWMSYYIQNNVSFSFGSRIHGTIMPILSGVPSLCYTMDARTREMTEFFDIPHVAPCKNSKSKCLYDWYLETDYSEFNEKFQRKFDDFECFLRKCGLVENINQENIFMSRKKTDLVMPEIVNQKQIDEMSKLIKQNKVIFNALDLYYRHL